MSKRIVEILITATVKTTVELEDGETLDDLRGRNVDIYLHGAGKNGHITKTDLGGDATIEVIG